MYKVKSGEGNTPEFQFNYLSIMSYCDPTANRYTDFSFLKNVTSAKFIPTEELSISLN